MVIQEAIRALVDRGEIEPGEARGAMEEIMTGAATPSQMGAFLAGLRLRGESPEIIAACWDVLERHAEPVATHDVIDVVGTGGDGADTINVSTAAAIVVAAAGGRVAKHGNRAASSKCGSADVLEALGARIDIGGPQVARIIDECGFCFLFAQRFHPAMKNVGGTRREMGVRTIFNVLGPLSNPAKPARVLAGVGVKALGPLVANAFAIRGIQRSIVVHSADGLDEISPSGVTHTWFVGDGAVEERDISPANFGLREHPLASIVGGDAQHNAHILRAVLEGVEGPALDFVLANAAAACYVAGLADDLRTGVDVARQAIGSGAARQVLDLYISLTQEYAE
jgi:anthranilate phosphoribosyltransferase